MTLTCDYVGPYALSIKEPVKDGYRGRTVGQWVHIHDTPHILEGCARSFHPDRLELKVNLHHGHRAAVSVSECKSGAVDGSPSLREIFRRFCNTGQQLKNEV
jgi:hypothetical protein